MQLALIHPAPPHPAALIARDVARIARPWALLACGAITYVAYTAFDSLPGLLQHAPRTVETSYQPAPVADQPSAIPLRMVTKCVINGTTSYSDADCAPGARAEVILLAPEPELVSPR